MYTHIRIYIILLCICISAVSFGQTEQLNKAMQFAQDGKQQEAIQVYEELLGQGTASAELYYNLGTLYLQEKKIGKAILFLERAIKYRPAYQDAITNLDLAKSEIDDPIFAISPFFLVAYWKSFSNLLPMLAWGVLSLLFLLGLVFLLNKILFNSMSRKKKWTSAALVITGLILSFAAAWTRYFDVKNDSYAIVMSEVDRLDGPDENSKNEEFPIISEGIKVKIKDSFEEYYQVKLPDSDESWIPKNNVERI